MLESSVYLFDADRSPPPYEASDISGRDCLQAQFLNLEERIEGQYDEVVLVDHRLKLAGCVRPDDADTIVNASPPRPVPSHRQSRGLEILIGAIFSDAL